MIEPPVLSVVVPCYNEQGNLVPLVTAIREALEPLNLAYEIVITDDCSADDSWKILQTLGAADKKSARCDWTGIVASRRRCGRASNPPKGDSSPRWTPICKIIRASCRDFWRHPA